MKNEFLEHIAVLQKKITASMEMIDGKGKFIEDVWKRPEGGGGKSRVMEKGKIFEKAGVNISAVNGILPKSLEHYFEVKDLNFFACGLSLVIHPNNPMIPTVHANYRYFELYYKNGKLKDQWFGGGQDLTPFYLIEESKLREKESDDILQMLHLEFAGLFDGPVGRLKQALNEDKTVQAALEMLTNDIVYNDSLKPVKLAKN